VSSPYEASSAFGGVAVAAERTFLRQVFAWMFLALALTTGVAIWFHETNSALNFFAAHPALFWVAIIGQLGLVIALRPITASPSLSVGVAAFVFFLYAAITGAVFSILLAVYTTDTVVGAFAGAAGVFAGMSIVGYTTRVDLSRYRGILIGALVGLLVSMVAWLLIGGSTFNLIIGFAGVLLFSGLTAFDIQRLKQMQAQGVAPGAIGEKQAILGALILYLDFVNLFLFLLRIFGGGRR
jgi:FtsH-binding integral membrane protein